MPRTKNTEEVVEETTEEVTISAKAIANELGIDPKAFRRWLRRNTEDRAGKGGRWNFTAERAEELKAAYAKPTEVEASDED